MYDQVEGIKMMARWLLGLKNDEVSAQKTFRMFAAFVAKKGNLSGSETVRCVSVLQTAAGV